MDVVAESNRIAEKVSFTTCCHLFEKLRATTGTKSKKTILSRFIQLWDVQYTNLCSTNDRAGAGRASFYPVLRLLLPQFDRARPAYGLREVTLTRLYIKAFGIAPKGPTAQRLTHPSSQGAKLAKGTDFADILFDTVRGCCREDSVLLLKDANDLLDRLARAKSMGERLVAMNTLIPLATAIEHKWIVRLIVRRDSGCGLSGTAVLQCIHPAAVRLWDVTQACTTY
ncbi:DNA ligase 4 [Paragonimus heterotremus]|uniref:DNA ligase 4 n=1 Tax=Paragonimus heterotremus TaxID=100268 RepID=A0A8J4WLZ6_9TREM|nr:DNA ligase 4 [Paragonimus heterotremus]